MYLSFQHTHDKRVVSLMHKDECIGEFSIEGEFDSGKTCSMSIHINDAYQGKGLSRILMQGMINHVQLEYSVSSQQLLFIDADASTGFWDHIGMTSNPYYDYGNVNREGSGYEKRISWKELKRYVYRRRHAQSNNLNTKHL
jgi:hypothetical protein